MHVSYLRVFLSPFAAYLSCSLDAAVLSVVLRTVARRRTGGHPMRGEEHLDQAHIRAHSHMYVSHSAALSAPYITFFLVTLATVGVLSGAAQTTARMNPRCAISILINVSRYNHLHALSICMCDVCAWRHPTREVWLGV